MLSAPPSRRLFPLLWLSYAFFIIYVTTLPFDFDPSIDHARERLSDVSHNPFLSSDGSRASRSDMIQNVVLFAPFGALTALAIRARPAQREHRHSLRSVEPRAPSPEPRVQIPDPPPRQGFRAQAESRVPTLGSRIPDPGSRVAAALLLSTLAGFALSAGVETLQLFTADRVPSLNDVLTNTVGALSGGIVAVLALVAAERTRAVPHATEVLSRCYPVILWGGVAAIAAWHPFNTTIDVSSIAGKVRALLSDPWQAGGGIGDEAVDAVRYAFFAASWAVVWRRWHLPRPALAAALAATLLGMILEASQFFVLWRMPGLKDVVVAMTGGSLGSIVYRASREWRPSTVAVLAIAAAWLATGLMLLNPWMFSVNQQPIQYLPFLGYYLPSPESAVTHSVELTLAFFPIGFIIGMVVKPPKLWLATVVVGAVLAVTLEYGQSWIVGRYADVTDAGVMVLGALAGAWASIPVRVVSEFRQG